MRLSNRIMAAALGSDTESHDSTASDLPPHLTDKALRDLALSLTDSGIWVGDDEEFLSCARLITKWLTDPEADRWTRRRAAEHLAKRVGPLQRNKIAVGEWLTRAAEFERFLTTGEEESPRA